MCTEATYTIRLKFILMVALMYTLWQANRINFPVENSSTQKQNQMNAVLTLMYHKTPHWAMIRKDAKIEQLT